MVRDDNHYSYPKRHEDRVKNDAFAVKIS